MKPTDGVKPLYVREFKGAFLEEAFMRGVRRDRPAREDGEELRDVMLWLWALEYCDSVASQIAFISNDSGFWDSERVHPQIDADLKTKEERIGVYRSITDFLQRHAPAPADATREWVEHHFQITAIEGQLIDRARRDLSAQLGGEVRDLAIEGYELLNGRIYDVARDTQFAELELKVEFRFTHLDFPISQENESFSLFTGGSFGSRFGSRYGGRFGGDRLGGGSRFGMSSGPGGVVPLANLLSAPEPTPRTLHCYAFAGVSVRAKNEELGETSLDSLTIDRAQLWKLAMAGKTVGS